MWFIVCGRSVGCLWGAPFLFRAARGHQGLVLSSIRGNNGRGRSKGGLGRRSHIRAAVRCDTSCGRRPNRKQPQVNDPAAMSQQKRHSSALRRCQPTKLPQGTCAGCITPVCGPKLAGRRPIAVVPLKALPRRVDVISHRMHPGTDVVVRYHTLVPFSLPQSFHHAAFRQYGQHLDINRVHHNQSIGTRQERKGGDDGNPPIQGLRFCTGGATVAAGGGSSTSGGGVWRAPFLPFISANRRSLVNQPGRRALCVNTVRGGG
jgi:hypothetical protein